MELSSPSPDVAHNVEVGLNDDSNDRMSYPNSSQPKRILLPNSPLSDSSSAPNSPLTFAFSPVTHNDDSFYASSYDTDFTSFIGSWDQQPSFGAGPSSSPSPNSDKGKQKAEAALASERDSQAASQWSDKRKGKSIDLSISLSHRLSFEFDFEFEQDKSNNTRAENLSPSRVDGPSSPTAVNNSLSPPSFSSFPSPITEPYDTEITHKRSFSSLSLKSLRSSSTRSFDRIRRPFARKNTKSSDNTRSELNPNSNDSSPSSSSPNLSASSFKNGIRKVFRRNNSRNRLEDTHSDALESPFGISARDEGGDEHEDALNQSIVSEATVSPRALSDRVNIQVEDILDCTYATPEGVSADNIFLEDEEIVYETTNESGTQSSLAFSYTPRDFFSELLPKELQLRILRHVISSYEEEYFNLSTSAPTLPWTAKIAESARWVGRERGIRELFRLSRVSKSWHSLAFDGQLNECMRFAPYVSSLCANGTEVMHPSSSQLSTSLLIKLAYRAGLFVRILDLRGWPHLNNEEFRAISTAISTNRKLTDVDKEPLADDLPHMYPDSLSSSVSCALSLDRGIKAETNLTHLNLRSCTNLTTHTIHYVLLNSPRLRMLDLHGLGVDAVNNSTCELLNVFCPNLERLDVGRCLGLDGTGLENLVGGGRDFEEDDVPEGIASKGNMKTRSQLKVLFASGICGISPDVMSTLARLAPSLEVLDLSYSDILDEGIGAFVWWDENMAEEEEDQISHLRRRVEVTARQMGIDPRSSTSPTLLSPSHHFNFTPTRTGTYFKRITSLRHLNLSSTHITDKACTLLACSVPKLECIELAGIGGSLQEEGLVKLFETTPLIRRIDLEDANRVGNAVLRALTPFVDRRTPELSAMDSLSPASSATLQPGNLLEHLILSYAQNINNSALLLLISSCTRLTTLEVDNTRISSSVVRSFVEIMRTRGTRNAKIATMDCRSVSESCVHELLDAGTVRPRIGFRAYEARAIGGFLDGRDREGYGSLVPPSFPSLRSLRDPTRVEIDECDDTRVVIKSFWSLQALDAALEAEGKRNGVRSYNDNGRSGSSSPGFGSGSSGPGSLSRPRWLSNWTRYLL